MPATLGLTADDKEWPEVKAHLCKRAQKRDKEVGQKTHQGVPFKIQYYASGTTC